MCSVLDDRLCLVVGMFSIYITKISLNLLNVMFVVYSSSCGWVLCALYTLIHHHCITTHYLCNIPDRVRKRITWIATEMTVIDYSFTRYNVTYYYITQYTYLWPTYYKYMYGCIYLCMYVWRMYIFICNWSLGTQ